MRIKSFYTVTGREWMVSLQTSWDQKKKLKKKRRKTKLWVSTSALLLFWQLNPPELPLWQNTEWHVSCWQFCQHRILRYRSLKIIQKTKKQKTVYKMSKCQKILKKQKNINDNKAPEKIKFYVLYIFFFKKVHSLIINAVGSEMRMTTAFGGSRNI